MGNSQRSAIATKEKCIFISHVKQHSGKTWMIIFKQVQTRQKGFAFHRSRHIVSILLNFPNSISPRIFVVIVSSNAGALDCAWCSWPYGAVFVSQQFVVRVMSKVYDDSPEVTTSFHQKERSWEKFCVRDVVRAYAHINITVHTHIERCT